MWRDFPTGSRGVDLTGQELQPCKPPIAALQTHVAVGRDKIRQSKTSFVGPDEVLCAFHVSRPSQQGDLLVPNQETSLSDTAARQRRGVLLSTVVNLFEAPPPPPGTSPR